MVAEPQYHDGGKRGHHDDICKAVSDLEGDIIWKGCILEWIFVYFIFFVWTKFSKDLGLISFMALINRD